MAEALLKTEDLFLEREGKPILCGVDLAVDEDKIYALLGANGAGKTTLAYTLRGLSGYHP